MAHLGKEPKKLGKPPAVPRKVEDAGALTSFLGKKKYGPAYKGMAAKGRKKA